VGFETVIETERLILRPFREDDIESSYLMNLDPELSRYTGDGGVLSREEIEMRIRKNVFGDYEKYGYGRFAVDWKQTGEFIGFSGLKFLTERNATDLGYRFRRDIWGRGIATEAGKASIHFGFQELCLDKIIGQVIRANTASVRVLEKLGFSYDSSFRLEGVECDLYILSPGKSSK
jgi:RimJ/RimL family protein N-acetyltransferase